jgi:redox-sensing transcriptional repressor
VEEKRIPESVIPRLSLYYRALIESQQADYISSEELARLTKFSSALVRRDLTYFGQFGTPGKGYNINGLKKEILRILGLNSERKVALAGVGNLGSALLAYKGFEKSGFRIVIAFDNDLKKIGKNLKGVAVRNISEMKKIIPGEKIKMAIVTVPVDKAQEVIDELISVGVKAILNFAPFRPHVPEDVELVNIDLTIELERLAYFIASIK